MASHLTLSTSVIVIFGMAVYIVLQVTYTETVPAKITSQIEKWINDTLSQPNKSFGNLPPCPYAKKAWVDGNVSVKMFTNFEEFEKGPWDNEVNIYVTDMTAWDLQEAAVEYNRRYPAYLFLEEHPDLTEEVDGFLVNQGEYGMMIVQQRAPLEEARKALQKTEYYDKWS